jgi:hypothetical protein
MLGLPVVICVSAVTLVSLGFTLLEYTIVGSNHVCAVLSEGQRLGISSKDRFREHGNLLSVLRASLGTLTAAVALSADADDISDFDVLDL